MGQALKRLAATIAASLLALSAAQAQQPRIPKDVRKAVLVSARHYMTAIACAEAPFVVAELEPYRHHDESSLQFGRFAVIWAADLGCQGGSASSTDNIVVVDVQPRGKFFVDAKRSSPNIEFNLSMQIVDRLVRGANDTLVVEGRELGPHDALCCATDRWRVTLKADASGNWSPTERVHLSMQQPHPAAPSRASSSVK